MNHSQMQELLSAYANDELSLTQREFVEEHLATCADCQKALAKYRSMRIQLTSLSATEINPDIREATMSQIEAFGTTSTPINVRKLLRPALTVAAIVVVAVAVLVFQLSGDGPGGGIAEAYAATEALQSYRIAGSTTVSANGESSEVGFEWEFAGLDRFRGKIVQNGKAEEFIIVGDDQYQRITPGSQMGSTVIQISTDGFDVFNPFVGKEGTLQLLDSLVDLRELPGADIGGVQTTHYQGKVDIDKIMDDQAATLDPASPDYQANLDALDIQRKITISVDLWISKDGFQIRQMKLAGAAPVTTSGGAEQIGGLTWDTLVEFFDFDAPITIERPLTPSGDVQSEWRLSGGPQAGPVVEFETR